MAIPFLSKLSHVPSLSQGSDADTILVRDASAGNEILGLTIGSGLSVASGVLSATGGTIGGSTGSVDNYLLRSDGTGGSTLQASAISLSDTADLVLGIAASTGGITRTIDVAGTNAFVNILLKSKGSGWIGWEQNGETLYLDGTTNKITIAPGGATDTDVYLHGAHAITTGTGADLLLGGGDTVDGTGGDLILMPGKETGTGTNGKIRLDTYGSGSVTGTGTYALAVDASGNIVEESLSGGGAWTSSGGYTVLNTTTDYVGIANATPIARLDIEHSAIFNPGTTAETTPALKVRGSYGGAIVLEDTAESGFMARAAGQEFNLFVGKITSTDTANDATVMTWLGSGNVGIGTTAPNNLLEVRNSENIGSHVTRVYPLRVTSWDNSGGNWNDQGVGIEFFSGAAGGNSGIVASIVGTGVGASPGTSGELIFSTNRSSTLTEAMRIDENGNVGIGNASPSNKLDVAGNIRMYDGGTSLGLYLRRDSASGQTITWQSYNGASASTSSAFLNAVYSGTESYLETSVYYSNGTNIRNALVVRGKSANMAYTGINTNAPAAPLHVYSAGAAYNSTPSMLIEDTSNRAVLWMKSDADQATDMVFKNETNGVLWDISARGSGEGYKLRFYPRSGTNSVGAEAVTFYGYNVGIGRDAPTERLEVDGNVETEGLIITDTSGVPKFKISYNATDDTLETTRL